MGVILIRCVIIYILLTFSIRIMGKRQIGELDVGDLVSTLLISELAAIPISDPDIPMLYAIVPILFIISVEILVSALKNKVSSLKKVVEGSPVYIIYKGRLLQNALIENRISINELMAEIREQGVFDISEINYAIIEQNGKLSIHKGNGVFAHTLILDGEIYNNAINICGAVDRVRSLLKKENVKDIMLLTVDDNGKMNIIRREKNGG